MKVIYLGKIKLDEIYNGEYIGSIQSKVSHVPVGVKKYHDKNGDFWTAYCGRMSSRENYRDKKEALDDLDGFLHNLGFK